MQFFFRTSENSGIGVGPIGAIFVGMVYLAVFAAGMVLAVVYLLGLLVFKGGPALVRALRDRGRGAV